MTPKELGYTNSPFSDSNSLMEHVRELNKRELQEREQRRQQALNKIQMLRAKIRREREASE